MDTQPKLNIHITFIRHRKGHVSSIYMFNFGRVFTEILLIPMRRFA